MSSASPSGTPRRPSNPTHGSTATGIMQHAPLDTIELMTLASTLATQSRTQADPPGSTVSADDDLAVTSLRRTVSQELLKKGQEDAARAEPPLSFNEAVALYGEDVVMEQYALEERRKQQKTRRAGNAVPHTSPPAATGGQDPSAEVAGTVRLSTMEYIPRAPTPKKEKNCVMNCLGKCFCYQGMK
ncbi:hypothetical protein QFC24_006996 [Naganishia onofrii]|uniref:Uncharacterized protein n=1 Tax=Naganishia onofrii TaxID=1851511 RepID=A0ACC2WWB5_9TREE|nr:hypothetical protein QFC24_006996 [Naganishia onofrii]